MDGSYLLKISSLKSQFYWKLALGKHSLFATVFLYYIYKITQHFQIFNSPSPQDSTRLNLVPQSTIIVDVGFIIL